MLRTDRTPPKPKHSPTRTPFAAGQVRRVDGHLGAVTLVEPSYLHPDCWFCRLPDGKTGYVFEADLRGEVRK